LEAEDVERTRQVYKYCLELLPHKHFTFAKIWLLYAKFEIRNKNLTVARKSLVWCYLKFFSWIVVVAVAAVEVDVAVLGMAAVVWCCWGWPHKVVFCVRPSDIFHSSSCSVVYITLSLFMNLFDHFNLVYEDLTFE
jgi:hypothetical protein